MNLQQAWVELTSPEVLWWVASFFRMVTSVGTQSPVSDVLKLPVRTDTSVMRLCSTKIELFLSLIFIWTGR